MAQNNPFLKLLKRYHRHPVRMVQELFKVEPDEWQADVLNDIADPEIRFISVRSGHGVGKSTLAAWALIWHLLTKYPGKAVVTAPTSGQLFDALFNEVKFWIRKLPEPIQKLFEVKRDRIELKAAPEGAFISARTSRAEQPEALQGIHAENVLLVVDEASGVPEAVFEAASGSMSGDTATTVLLGNPVRTSGLFFESHHKGSGFWKTYHVSCLDSPRVSDEFVAGQAAQYGETSNVFRIRVLGEFPLSDDDTIIPMDYAQSAQQREGSPEGPAPVVWGLDVARKGSNASVLTKRKGRYVWPQKEWRGLELMELVGRVREVWMNTPDRLRPQEINVDALGLGYGVVDRMRELGMPVRAVNVSELPALKERYRNLKTELWFAMREWLEARDVTLPEDDDLLSQLIAVRYTPSSNGTITVESKDSLENRGLASPDKADSLALTFAGPASKALYGRRSNASGAPIRRPYADANI